MFPFTRWICRFYFYRFIDHTLTICCSLSFSSAITSRLHILLQAIISTFPSSGKISLFLNLRYKKDSILNVFFFLYYTFDQCYCKDDGSFFFTSIIKVMHVYCVDNLKNRKKKREDCHHYFCILHGVLGEPWIPQLYGRWLIIIKWTKDRITR